MNFDFCVFKVLQCTCNAFLSLNKTFNSMLCTSSNQEKS